MSDRNGGSAAELLAEVGRRQAAAVRQMAIPLWYWRAIALGCLVLGLVVDTAAAPVIPLAAVVFAAFCAALTVAMITGIVSGARASSALLGGTGAMAIVLFVLATVGISLGVAFGLRASGFSYPATGGTAVTALALMLGGPRLMTYLETVMLANRDVRQ